MEGLRTLIVDDSSVMRKIVARALQQGGVSLGQILEAGNGSEALEILRREKVDLVLSDINMPVMNGLEFVRQLRSVENAQGIPVVMITTEGSESHVMEAISCGARGYIRKPFTPDQMKQHVLPLLAKLRCGRACRRRLLIRFRRVVRLPAAFSGTGFRGSSPRGFPLVEQFVVSCVPGIIPGFRCTALRNAELPHAPGFLATAGRST